MMKFHPDKCQVLAITKKKTLIKKNYNLHDHTLEHVPSAKYLGVTITSDLKWESHVTNISQKANKTIGFLKRNLNISNGKIKEKAYISLVRPTVEYASPVWDPYLQKDKYKIKMCREEQHDSLQTGTIINHRLMTCWKIWSDKHWKREGQMQD